jgi:hypothetical protein
MPIETRSKTVFIGIAGNEYDTECAAAMSIVYGRVLELEILFGKVKDNFTNMSYDKLKGIHDEYVKAFNDLNEAVEKSRNPNG